MLEFIANILGNVINLIYNICNNYGITIILFTILFKIALLPLSIIVQKNSIKMIKMKPELEELKIKYCDDKDKYMEEQIKLFKKEKYSSIMGLFPLIIQIVILMGLTKCLSSSNIYLKDINEFGFLGFDLNTIPNLKNFDYNSLMIVIISVTTLLLCFFQNKENVLQIEENYRSQLFTTILTTVITIYFSIYVPSGVSLYWSIGNVFAIFQLYLLNWFYNPKKYIDYERLNKVKQIIKERKNEENNNKIREKKDYKKFLENDSKQLVFYSESNGFYKYFKPMIEYILDNSNVVIHYITSDAKDKIFETKEKRIHQYYINTNKLIPLFMKMDSDIVVMTTPDLQRFYLKRSMVRKDIEYIFTDHGLTSSNLAYREGALDYYDTIFATSIQQVDEIKAIEELRKTKRKNIVKTGYCLIDQMIKEYNNLDEKENRIKTILIAPSYQEDNIMDSCLDEIVSNLLEKNLKIIVRPHPQYIKRNPLKMQEILEKYKKYFNENFKIQQDFSDTDTIYKADIVITDWSGIGYEFAFATAKPCLFINTKIKIINPAYNEIDVIPADVTFRNVIGKSIDKEQVQNIFEYVEELFNNQKKYKEKIIETRDKYLFNVGRVSEIQGKYIIDKLEEKENARMEENLG